MKTIAKQFVLITIGAFLVTGCATTHKTQEWEYKTYTSLTSSDDSYLDSLGKDGWVLVGFTYVPSKQTGANDEYHYVFKRHVK